LPGYAVANVIAILAMALFVIIKINAIARLRIIGNTGPAFLAACLAGAISYLASLALQDFTGMITGLIVGSISYFYVLIVMANACFELGPCLVSTQTHIDSIVTRVQDKQTSGRHIFFHAWTQPA
jgi:hypothetical protein